MCWIWLCTSEICESRFKLDVNLGLSYNIHCHKSCKVATTHQFTRNKINEAFRSFRKPSCLNKALVLIQRKHNCCIFLADNLKPPPPDTIIVSIFILWNPSNRDFRRYEVYSKCVSVTFLLQTYCFNPKVADRCKWHCCQIFFLPVTGPWITF